MKQDTNDQTVFLTSPITNLCLALCPQEPPSILSRKQILLLAAHFLIRKG